MNRILYFILFTGFSIAFLPAIAQEKKASTQPSDTTQNKIFEPVEVHPEFPGGEEALRNFILSKTNQVEMINKPEGLVVLAVIIPEKGKIEDITVLRSLEPGLDSIAVNIVKQMPDWIPGSFMGRIVRVRYILPIRFGNSSSIQTKEKRKEKHKN